MGKAKLPGGLLRGWREPVGGPPALPGLECPVAAVGGGAAGDKPRECWAVVRSARVPEGLPGVLAVCAPTAGVVEPELHLRAGDGRRHRVSRAPREHVPEL